MKSVMTQALRLALFAPKRATSALPDEHIQSIKGYLSGTNNRSMNLSCIEVLPSRRFSQPLKESRANQEKRTQYQQEKT
jgi:hypothetical protein